MIVDTHIARQLLAELEVISHGTTASWNTGGGRNADRPGRPAGEFNPPHIALRARLDAALTQTQVDRVAHAARQALKQAKYTPETGDPEWGSFHWRRQIARDVDTGKRTVEQAVRHYSVSRATIYRYLAAYGTKAA